MRPFAFFRYGFENDVKMYGTETLTKWIAKKVKFENDVKMYGTETLRSQHVPARQFENDVKTYGTETCSHEMSVCFCLRMM